MDAVTEQALHRFTSVLERVRPDFARAVLFGSRARGDQRPDSDADVAVLLNGEPGNALDAILQMSDIAYDILLDTGIHIQPVAVWVSQWEDPARFSNPALIRNIRREGIPI